MASTFLSLVTLYFINTYNQTVHLCECVLHSLTYILGKDVETRATVVQYSTPLRSFGSLVLCCHLSKTLNTQHAKVG